MRSPFKLNYPRTPRPEEDVNKVGFRYDYVLINVPTGGVLLDGNRSKLMKQFGFNTFVIVSLIAFMGVPRMLSRRVFEYISLGKPLCRTS